MKKYIHNMCWSEHKHVVCFLPFIGKQRLTHQYATQYIAASFLLHSFIYDETKLISEWFLIFVQKLVKTIIVGKLSNIFF